MKNLASLIILFLTTFLQGQSNYTNNIASLSLDYKVGTYILTDLQLIQLDSIYEVITSEVHIELNGYADNQGSDSANLLLSEKRNNHIMEYFTNKGVDSNRITKNSHGENYISNHETSELVKQRNRRVVVSIVEQVQLVELKGILTSQDSVQRLKGKINVYFNGKKKEFHTDAVGDFQLELPVGKEIHISYSAKGHFSQLHKVTLSNASSTTDLHIALNKMMMHSRENTNLEFIRGKSIFKEKSDAQLDAIYCIFIIVSSHRKIFYCSIVLEIF